MKLPLLDPYNPEQDFPPVHKALTEPEGLLAIGGCLSPTRIINAYRQGVFPWFDPDMPILWWSPNPRLVLYPAEISISRSLKKTLRQQKFSFKVNTAFANVIEACSQPRLYADGTWIGTGIKQAYLELHRQGVAHSAEAWLNNELVGGLYGIALGQVFFGESMFHTETDASKVAFALLVQYLQTWDYQLIDCQVYTHHLASFGAVEIERTEFIRLLEHYCNIPADAKAWRLS